MTPHKRSNSYQTVGLYKHLESVSRLSKLKRCYIMKMQPNLHPRKNCDQIAKLNCYCAQPVSQWRNTSQSFKKSFPRKQYSSRKPVTPTESLTTECPCKILHVYIAWNKLAATWAATLVKSNWFTLLRKP